jgi:Ca2+:H+ antiporter
VRPIRSPSKSTVTTQIGAGKRRIAARSSSPLTTRPIIGGGLLASARMSRRELAEIAIHAGLVVAAALAHFLDATPVLQFVLAAVAIAGLARLVGSSTEQLGGRLGSAGAGAIQSALGNLPELFIALFALHDGLVRLVQAALIGSVLANSVLVLGIAFTVGGLRNGTQSFDSPRARIVATLTVLAAATLSVPSFAHAFHAPAAAHSRSLSLVCAGVLLAVFVLTLPGLLQPLPNEPAHEPPRWSMRMTVGVLTTSACAAALVSDWFVSALQPAIETLHMSESFAGLVVVAIAGNAVENVVGVQLAARNRPDFAISVIVNSSLQVALALTPALVFLSLLFATNLTLVFPVLLAISLIFAAGLGALVVYDGESTWPEGVILIGLYCVIAASFWWGA